MYCGIDARGTTMSMMSSAPAAFAIQNAFSRASISLRARRRRQHVHVERAELGEQRRELLGVLVEAVVAAVLEHDDEIRERLRLDRRVDAELDAVRSSRSRPS